MTPLSFSPEMSKILQFALDAMGDALNAIPVVIGGGTVLAARWGHRHSTDIDLFTGDAEFHSVRDELASTLLRRRDLEIQIHPNVIMCESKTGPGLFSLGGSGNVTSTPLADQFESGTGIGMHSTEEILARKIRARMVNRELYAVRDLYDVAVCAFKDEDALSRAIKPLYETEVYSVKYDIGRLSVNRDSPLIDPKYKLLDDDEKLFRVLFGVLTEGIGAVDVMKEAGIEHKVPAGANPRGSGCKPPSCD